MYVNVCACLCVCEVGERESARVKDAMNASRVTNVFHSFGMPTEADTRCTLDGYHQLAGKMSKEMGIHPHRTTKAQDHPCTAMETERKGIATSAGGIP